MIKAELLSLDLKRKDGVPFFVVTFSKAAKWTPTKLVAVEINIKQFLDVTESILNYKETKELKEIPTSNPIKLESSKTMAKVLHGEYYFPLKMKDLYSIFTSKLELLVDIGIIQINKQP
jgi:hypothetical protein